MKIKILFLFMVLCTILSEMMLTSCSENESEKYDSNPYVVNGEYSARWVMGDWQQIGKTTIIVDDTGVRFAALPIEWLVSFVRKNNEGKPETGQVTEVNEGQPFYMNYIPESTYYGDYMLKCENNRINSNITIGTHHYKLDIDVGTSRLYATFDQTDGSFLMGINLNGIYLTDLETNEMFHSINIGNVPLTIILAAKFNLK